MGDNIWTWLLGSDLQGRESCDSLMRGMVSVRHEELNWSQDIVVVDLTNLDEMKSL